MSENDFDIDAYIQRIKYEGEKLPAVDTLKSIHHSQLFTIPFENFDIQLGRGINLDPGAIFRKLVHKKRGGYCFELNGIFLMALNALGFSARALLARVHLTGTPTGRGHQIELITIQKEQWIADVGFGGDTPRFPIPLIFNQPITHDGQTLRLVRDDLFGIILQSFKEEEWRDLYSFDLGYVCPADIDYGNHFTSTSSRSRFTFARVAALPVENGGITLLNNTLKKVVAGKEIVQELSGGQGYLEALKTNFGIELDAPYGQLRSLPGSE